MFEFGVRGYVGASFIMARFSNNILLQSLKRFQAW